MRALDVKGDPWLSTRTRAAFLYRQALARTRNKPVIRKTLDWQTGRRDASNVPPRNRQRNSPPSPFQVRFLMASPAFFFDLGLLSIFSFTAPLTRLSTSRLKRGSAKLPATYRHRHPAQALEVTCRPGRSGADHRGLHEIVDRLGVRLRCPPATLSGGERRLRSSLRATPPSRVMVAVDRKIGLLGLARLGNGLPLRRAGPDAGRRRHSRP